MLLAMLNRMTKAIFRNSNTLIKDDSVSALHLPEVEMQFTSFVKKQDTNELYLLVIH